MKKLITRFLFTTLAIIHQEALYAQTLPEKICKVIELVITIINSTSAKALNYRQFKEF